MWTAFPPSDYYEDSVTVGVSPRRPSRVPLTFGNRICQTSLDSLNPKRRIVLKTLLTVLVGVVLVVVVVWLALALFGIAV